MKFVEIIRMIGLCVLVITLNVSCNSSGPNVQGDQPKNMLVSTNVKEQVPQGNSANETSKDYASISDLLEQAKSDGKAAFVVVTGNEAEGTEKAFELVERANAIYGNAVIGTLNRDDRNNASFVNELNLNHAPIPLILVVSPSGIPTGALLPSQSTANDIVSLIPSPKLEQVYQTIGNGHHVIIAFTKASFSDRAEVLKECKEAVALLDNEAVFLEVDMDDKLEASFMEQLRVNGATAQSSITVVINKQGQVAGIATTIPDARKLTEAANTPIQGGCGFSPAGCGR